MSHLRLSRRNPVFRLPPYRVGPYTMQVVPATKQMFSDKRRIVENDWNEGRLLVAAHLPTRRALECLMRALVSAIHYRSGLNDHSDEESHTHSLATGMVEIARNSPQFWEGLHQILEEDYCPGSGWTQAVKAHKTKFCDEAYPSEIVFDQRVCTIDWIDASNWGDDDAYGYYWLKQGKIHLRAELKGANLALVTLHEVLHFLHECVGLRRKKTAHARFKHAQTYTLLRFIQQNPEFWRWWLGAAKPTSLPQRLAA